MGGRGSNSAGTRRASEALAATARNAYARRTARSGEYLAGAANSAISEAIDVRQMVRNGANPRVVNTSAIERGLLTDVRAASVGTRLTVTAAGNFRDTYEKGSEGWRLTGSSPDEGESRLTDQEFTRYLLGSNAVYYSD